jgi:hypothetical protein
MHTKLLGTTKAAFDVIGQRLIRFSISVRLEKKWEYNGTVHQLLINFKKAYDSARREAFSLSLEYPGN